MTSATRHRLFLVTAPLWLAWPTGCAERDPPPPPLLDLTVRLPAGIARAGQVRRPDELVGGPVAKGRVGDFKIYNSRVAFVIEDAGTASGYAPFGGKILDADRVRPEGAGGRSRFGEWVSGFDQRVCRADRVTVLANGAQGGPAIVRAEGPDASIPLLQTVMDTFFPTRDRHTWITIDYTLEPDADYLRVETAIENRGPGIEEFQMRQFGFLMGDGAQPWLPRWGFETQLGPSAFYAAVADDVSYGFFDEVPIGLIVNYSAILIASQGSFALAPGQKKTFRTIVAVGEGGTGSLERAWRAAMRRSESLATLQGRVIDTSGSAVAGALVHVAQPVEGGARETLALARTAADGSYLFELPAGSYEALATSAVHPPSPAVAFTVAEPSSAVAVAAPILLVAASGILRALVVDSLGNSLPAKVTIRALGDTPTYPLPKIYGTPRYTAGAAKLVYAHTGQAEARLPPGRYRVSVSRGFEYDLAEREVELAPDAVLPAHFVLRRVVDTTGYLCGDFHIHAQKSPDSDDMDEEKVAAFAAEGLEVPVSTDHEFVADYAPTIQRLGLGAFMRSIIGEEVTTTTLGHFNAFPLELNPAKPNQGFIEWHFKSGPEIFAEIRANAGRPVLQLNHPRSPAIGGYFSATGYDPETGTTTKPDQWSNDFDAIEVVNGKRIEDPTQGVYADWYSFLNQGKRVTATGNSDNHHIFTGEVGFPRNYVRVDSDDFLAFNERAFVESVRAGQVIVSGGPFITVALGGKGPGAMVTVTGGEVRLDVVVQAPSWMDVNRLYVVANGEVALERELAPADADPANPVVRFRGTLPFTPTRDTWYVVHVRGSRGMDPVVAGARPFAFTNAIYVDVDGNGRFDAPGLGAGQAH
jgi:hypothetical protein